MGKPSFIIIGTQRGGTTSLYNYLVEHPDIKPAHKKETYFFDVNFKRGLEWYQSLFPDGFTGEATPYYMFYPLAPQRIKKLLPDVKFIVLLRNPVERAYSHYKLEVGRKTEHLPFEEAIDAENGRLAGEETKLMLDENYSSYRHFCQSYLSKGIYVEQLKRWFDFFPKEQFAIIKSDMLLSNPSETYKKLLKFLGLPEWELKAYIKHNQSNDMQILPDTRKGLVKYFESYNKELYRLLGEDFNWQ